MIENNRSIVRSFKVNGHVTILIVRVISCSPIYMHIYIYLVLRVFPTSQIFVLYRIQTSHANRNETAARSLRNWYNASWRTWRKFSSMSFRCELRLTRKKKSSIIKMYTRECCSPTSYHRGKLFAHSVSQLHVRLALITHAISLESMTNRKLTFA